MNKMIHELHSKREAGDCLGISGLLDLMEEDVCIMFLSIKLQRKWG